VNPNAFHKIGYGLYIVSSRDGDKRNGQIANTVFQVTSEPPKIAVALNKANLTHEMVQKGGVFGVSVLAQDTPLSFIGKFGFKSGREEDKFDGVKFQEGKLGVPLVLDHALALLEARVTQTLDVGSHTIFVAGVEDAIVLREGEAMTYAYYHLVKGGKEPKTAPVYHEDEAVNLPRYKCERCGYIYDPETGDPVGGIPPGTPFEEIPDTWVCPICGASKARFHQA